MDGVGGVVVTLTEIAKTSLFVCVTISVSVTQLNLTLAVETLAQCTLRPLSLHLWPILPSHLTFSCVLRDGLVQEHEQVAPLVRVYLLQLETQVPHL